MQQPSPVTDDQLRNIRDQLITAQGKVPRAWQIADIVQRDFKHKMHESTIRGRFIEMGEPLRGGPDVAVPAEQEKEVQVKQEIKVEALEILDEMKAYIPPDNEFEVYVERPTDIKLGIHYDIGPSTGRYKYPITQGKQGTGKTFSHAFYAWKRKLPFFLFSCYEDFKLQKLFGDKTIVSGTVRFQESLFVRAIQGPSVILFDEVNAVSNTNSFDFHALLQNRELFIKDANDGQGHTYRLHKECRVGFAQNPKSAKYIGGNIKPSNFLGRCTFLTYPEFSVEDITTAMKKRFPSMKVKELEKFVKFYFGVVKVIDSAALPLDVSIRQLTNVIDLSQHGMDLKDALYDGMISMLDAVSQPNAKEAIFKLAQATWKELMPIEMQQAQQPQQAPTPF